MTLPEYLRPGDCLILNNSGYCRRVCWGTGARRRSLRNFAAYRPGRQCVECLVRPGKKLRKGAQVSFGDGELTAEVVDELPGRQPAGAVRI